MKNILMVGMLAATLFAFRMGHAEWLGLMNSGAAIDVPGLGASFDLDLDFDRNNNAVAVISQQQSSYVYIFETRQSYGGTTWSWDGNRKDNVSLTNNVLDLALDINSNGQGFMSFAQENSSTNRIYGSGFNWNNTNVFSMVNSSDPIDTNVAFNSTQPAVTQAGTDQAISVFVKDDGGGTNRLFASRWANNAWRYWTGIGWNNLASAQPVDTSSGATNVSRPAIATSSEGEVFVVYTKEGSPNRIHASRFDGTVWYYWGVGGWVEINTSGSTAPISINAAGNCGNPRLVALPGGRMLCVYEWREPSTANDRIHSTVYSGTNWSPAGIAEFVDVAGNTCLSWSPDVSASSFGKVIAVYAQRNLGNNIQHVFSTEWDGADWFPLNSNNPIDGAGSENNAAAERLTPRIEFDALGNAECIFQQYDTSSTPNRNRVFANYFQGPPRVTSLVPNRSVNTGSVTITFNGFNFSGGTLPAQKVNVWLHQVGETNIPGINIQVSTPTFNFFTARSFTAEFDLLNKKVGKWNLTVENPDGQRYTWNNAFGITLPDLDKTYVYPNPVKQGAPGAQNAQSVRFQNLTQEVTLSIFNMRGELVRTLEKNDNELYTDWDLRNNVGKSVAPGIYLFRAESPEGSIRKGKFMVIR